MVEKKAEESNVLSGQTSYISIVTDAPRPIIFNSTSVNTIHAIRHEECIMESGMKPRF